MSEKSNISYVAAGQTDVGRVRSSNQDAVLLLPELDFFAVSDGMGGLSNGGDTSEYVCRGLPGLIEACCADAAQCTEPDYLCFELEQAVRLLSDRLYESLNAGGPVRYGATLVGVWLVENTAYFVNLGDSRAYVLPRDGQELKPMTNDMNLAGLLLRRGDITREEAERSPGRCRLTAFVGMQAPATPELSSSTVQPGDRILLCSDGLYGMVKEPELVQLLRAGDSPEECCKKLIQKANDNGGEDNISALCIEIR